MLIHETGGHTVMTNTKHTSAIKIRSSAIIIAVLLIAVTIASAACLTTTSPPAVNTTPAVAEPAATGYLQVNGEPGYTVYLDGTRIGQLESVTKTFSNITPGIHDVTVEQFGVMGSTEVDIEPDKTESVSIGLSKNQILVRMAKVLGWDKY